MNRIAVRYSVFVMIFIVAMIFFSIILNQGSTDMTMEMPMASLPVASIISDEYCVNEMHGYTNPMEVSTFRETITTIGEDRSLQFKLDLYGQDMKGLAFELRTVDGNRLIERTNVTDYKREKDNIYATVYLKDLIEINKEYSFTIILTLKDGREVYYYTRVIQCDQTLTRNKLDFVMYFHNRTLNKDQVKELTKYIEPSSEGDNSSFYHVDIHSSLDQLSYGDMEIVEMSAPLISICEYGNNIGTVKLNFVLTNKDENGTNIYLAEEYYRIKYGKERFYLLDYERTMEELFLMEKSSFANNKIVLGIQDEKIHYEESDGGNILAFTNAGRLFCYDVSENNFARLFSFFDKENFDVRTYYRKSEVKILDVEENGNVTFLIYGYMNRGIHEGEVGIEVCYYNSLLNTVEEEFFVEYDKAPDILIRDVEKLSYCNGKGDLFTLIDGDVYKIGVEEKIYEKIIPDVKDDNFKVSEDHKMIAWAKEQDEMNITTVCVMNLHTENVMEIKAGNDEYLRTIGFMNNDLVYGIVNQKDISKNSIGTMVQPMHKVLIQDEQGKILKKYENEEIYILDGEINENQLTLLRAKGTRREEAENSNLSLKPIEADQITSNNEEEEGTNKIQTAVTNLYETIQQFELKKEIETRTIKFLTPREVMYEGERKIRIKNDSDMLRYLVYKKGEIIEIFTNVSIAVNYAYEHTGTVLDLNGNELYRRAEISIRNQIMAIEEPGIDKDRNSLAVCLDTLLAYEGISRNTMIMLEKGQSVEKIMRDNLKDCTILNLSDCPLDAMLYYVNLDNPVLAVMDDGEAVLIIGFNQQNVVLMNPENGKIYKKGMNDSRMMFETSGNQFITYVSITESI